MFRDMTQTTASKARRKKKLVPLDEPTSSPESVSTFTSTSTELTTYTSPSPPPEVLKIQVGELETYAVNFWVTAMLGTATRHMAGVGQASLMPMLGPGSSMDSTASYALKAVSLAAYSRFGGDQKEVVLAAQEMYGLALKSLLASITSPTERLKNSTLLSVNMMVAADSLLATDEAPHRQWSAHINALASLLALRGHEGLQDWVVAKLYLTVRSFLVEGSETPVPPDNFFRLPEEQYTLQLRTYVNSPAYALLRTTVEIPILREETLAYLNSTTSPSKHSQISTIMEKLAEVDARVVAWSTSLPEEFEYVVVHPSSKSRQNGLHYECKGLHLYETARVNRMWNGWRCARIFLNALMLQCQTRITDPLDQDTTPDMPFVDTLQSLADDICSSVPIFLRPKDEAHRYRAVDNATEDTSDLIVASGNAWFVMWPLYVAQGILTLPYLQRKWIRACLVRIADMFRLRQAMHLVELADKEPGRPLFIPKWDEALIENVFEASFSYGYGGR